MDKHCGANHNRTLSKMDTPLDARPSWWDDREWSTFANGLPSFRRETKYYLKGTAATDDVLIPLIVRYFTRNARRPRSDIDLMHPDGERLTGEQIFSMNLSYRIKWGLIRALFVTAADMLPHVADSKNEIRRGRSRSASPAVPPSKQAPGLLWFPCPSWPASSLNQLKNTSYEENGHIFPVLWNTVAEHWLNVARTDMTEREYRSAGWLFLEPMATENAVFTYNAEFALHPITRNLASEDDTKALIDQVWGRVSRGLVAYPYLLPVIENCFAEVKAGIEREWNVRHSFLWKHIQKVPLYRPIFLRAPDIVPNAFADEIGAL